MAIENVDNSTALYKLGNLYEKQKKLYLAEKYYLMAIENGNLMATSKLGCLYYERNKFKLAEKYYLMVI